MCPSLSDVCYQPPTFACTFFLEVCQGSALGILVLLLSVDRRTCGNSSHCAQQTHVRQTGQRSSFESGGPLGDNSSDQLPLFTLSMEHLSQWLPAGIPRGSFHIGITLGGMERFINLVNRVNSFVNFFWLNSNIFSS